MIRRIFLMLIGAMAVTVLLGQKPAKRQAHAWDIAVWDRLLTSAPANVPLLRAGDMILPRNYVQKVRDWLAAQVGELQPEAAFQGSVTLWPGGIVYYQFAADITTLHQKAFIDAAADWATFANVSFVQRTSQPDYLYVQNGTGNSSGVGKLGGPQDFFISAWTRGVLCHELGHALGLVHEHQRADRDTYVTILTQNIQSGYEFAFALLPDSNNRGAYDFLSIMHYDRHAFATNPSLDTIEPNSGYTQYIDIMGNTYGRELSQLDRQGMVSVYGAGPVISSVVTNTKDSGLGSLRAAIFYGIDHPNTTITFNIPTNDPGHANNVYTIQPTDVMTSPGAGTTINGATQPNGNPTGPSIYIDGTNWPVPVYTAPGILITDANSTVRGVGIVNSSTDGIQISGAGATGNKIAGCYIGVAGDGTTAVQNTYSNVSITNGANGNTVGGTVAADRNVISGNSNAGVYIADQSTTNNIVAGNYIGTDRTGAVALANGYAGVVLANGAHGNRVGGTSAGAGNVISGNAQGIAIYDAGTNQNYVQGNLIGLAAGGSASLANNGRGVSLFGGAQQNVIGGNAVGAGNVISGNAGDGIDIVDATTSGNTVAGNLIGLDFMGTARIANAGSGVYVFGGAHGNVIGGTIAGTGNFLSGNGGDGITISDNGSSGNSVQGNTIGLNLAGNVVPNIFRGVTLQNGAQSNLVGGSTAGATNIIAGNTDEGIAIFDPTTNQNSISQNSIFSNGALGIDLNGDGVTPNDNCDGDSGPNNLQNFPVLTSALVAGGIVAISGTLNSTASTAFRVEFFSNGICDSSGHGEGQTFLGSVNVTTAANCNVSFGPLTFPLASGQTSVTSTATDPNGNTSEFSNCIQVTAAPTPTPTPASTITPTPTSTPTPSPTVNISGTLSYCSNPVPGPVPNVTMTLTGSSSSSTLSDSSGNYTFSSLPSGGSYTVTPTKAMRSPGSAGINTVDVVAIQRHFLNLGTPLSGCRLIAADVNGVGGVNTVDVIAVQRFFLGLSTGIANVGKYRFNPANRSYSGVTTNQTGQNYDTLVFGDVASPFVE